MEVREEAKGATYYPSTRGAGRAKRRLADDADEVFSWGEQQRALEAGAVLDEAEVVVVVRGVKDLPGVVYCETTSLNGKRRCSP